MAQRGMLVRLHPLNRRGGRRGAAAQAASTGPEGSAGRGEAPQPPAPTMNSLARGPRQGHLGPLHQPGGSFFSCRRAEGQAPVKTFRVMCVAEMRATRPGTWVLHIEKGT